MTSQHPDSDRRIALVDLLDRVLAGGVVVAGDITLSIADVDLVEISLRTLVSSVKAAADITSTDITSEQRGIEA